MVRISIQNLDYTVLLSDGWYQIRAKLDQPLQEFVKLKRIFLGQKLHICGASVRSLSSVIFKDRWTIRGLLSHGNI
jgi:hypothetical protein